MSPHDMNAVQALLRGTAVGPVVDVTTANRQHEYGGYGSLAECVSAWLTWLGATKDWPVGWRFRPEVSPGPHGSVKLYWRCEVMNEEWDAPLLFRLEDHGTFEPFPGPDEDGVLPFLTYGTEADR